MVGEVDEHREAGLSEACPREGPERRGIPLPIRAHLLVFAVVVGVVGLMGGAVLGWRTWRLVQRAWVADSLRMAYVAVSVVDHLLQPAMFYARHLAERVEYALEAGEPLNGPRGRQVVEEASHFFSASSLVDLEGRPVAVSSGLTPDLSVGDQAYFRRALETGQPVLSEPIVGKASGVPLVVLAVPLRAHGEMVGVFTATLHLDRFQALARTVAGGERGFLLVLVSPEGRFVVPPDPNLLGLPVEDYTNLDWGRLASAREPVSVSWTLRHPGSGGQEGYLGAFVRAPWSGWGAMVVRPWSALNREGLTYGLVASLVVLGSALAIGVPGLLVLWNHARGLRALAEEMQRAELDGASEPARLSPSLLGSRELTLLEERFSQMLAHLRRQHRELQNAYKALQTASFQTMLTLADALDLREGSTGYHSRRVGEFARILARRMGLPEAEVERIALGAMLHDIGKIGIPDAILCKPGPLTPEEWDLMRQHPRMGSSLLSSHPELVDIARMVLTHHERWDGRGYPFGLQGEEIPLGSRIFAVVDAFDAMIFDRPYRKAMTMDQAREEIRRCAGTQFDPAVVEAFLSVPTEEWERVIYRYKPAPLTAFRRTG